MGLSFLDQRVVGRTTFSLGDSILFNAKLGTHPALGVRVPPWDFLVLSYLLSSVNNIPLASAVLARISSTLVRPLLYQFKLYVHQSWAVEAVDQHSAKTFLED